MVFFIRYSSYSEEYTITRSENKLYNGSKTALSFPVPVWYNLFGKTIKGGEI